jgi:hypothetical protein
VKYALILLKSLYMVRKKNQNVYCGDQLDEQLSEKTVIKSQPFRMAIQKRSIK